MKEMKHSGFEWLGSIPKNWDVLRVKDGFAQKKSKAQQEDPVVLSLARSGVKIRNMDNAEGQFAASYFDYNPVTIDDILINPMDLVSGDNCSLSKVEGVISPAYVNLRYKAGFNPAYYQYYFKYQYWSMAFFANGKGVSFDNRWTLNSETLMKYPLITPPFDDQTRIANFLDKKCPEIDALMVDIQAQIETLEQYKRSAIIEVVTKGLSPNVEMKDSGIEWIGEIPATWKVMRIGRLFRLRSEKNHLPEDKVQLLSLYAGKGVFPTGNEGTTQSGNHAQTVDGYNIVKKNDIVVNIILAWMGSLGISNYDGVCSPAYDVYEPNLSYVVPRYYHYVFRTPGIAGECFKYGRGIMLMRWRTYSSEFKTISVPIPPLAKQQQIADYLDAKCSEIEDCITTKKEQLSTLEAYKKSLIYEYVTGKKEIVET